MGKRIISVGPQKGDLRVFNIVNVPGEGVFYPVKSVIHGVFLIECLAESQILQPEVTSNAFGLEVFTGEEWESWDEDGQDNLDEWAEERKIGLRHSHPDAVPPGGIDARDGDTFHKK